MVIQKEGNWKSDAKPMLKLKTSKTFAKHSLVK
jgi:hypothetical protein